MKRNNIYRILKLLSFCSILIFLLSCSEEDNNLMNNNSISSLEISTGDLYPQFDPEIKDYYVTSLNCLNSIDIIINDFNITKRIYINGQKVTNKVTSIHLLPSEDVIIEIGQPLNKKTYTIHYLPNDLPKTNLITKNNPSEGFIFVSLFELVQNDLKDFCYLAILNNDGIPVYYKRISNEAVFNFKCFITNTNEKRYSYNSNIDGGKVIILNEKFEEINQLSLLPFNGHGIIPVDVHDFIYLNDNHYIVPGIYFRENVNLSAYGGGNSVKVTEFMFQEIFNNQVVFEWNSANHPELFNATDTIYFNPNSTTNDYFHFNSIAIDPNDQNFIISARHTNQIYKINRTSGEIIWRFGGNTDNFNLTGNQIISHTHHATILPNGNLLLFDNGVTKTPKQSRIAEFSLNESNLTANLVYEYSDLGRYFDIMGSAQKLENGNYFIGWGGNVTSQINANKSDITEIDSNGNIVLDISFSNNPNSFTYSYRALKYNITF